MIHPTSDRYSVLFALSSTCPVINFGADFHLQNVSVNTILSLFVD